METGKKNKEYSNSENQGSERFIEDRTQLVLSLESHEVQYLVSTYPGNEVIKHGVSQIETSDDLNTFLSNSALSKYSFKKIGVRVSSAFTTLVPEGMFIQEKLSSFIYFNYRINFGSAIRTDFIPEIKVHNIYVVNEEREQVLLENFPDIEFLNTTTHLLKKLVFRNIANTMYCYISKNHFECFICENHKLLFHNRFNYKSAEDILYYILWTCEQSENDFSKLNIDLLGQVDKNSAIVSLLKSYNKNAAVLANHNFEREAEISASNLNYQSIYALLN